jgi:hypothetical protein
MLLPLRYKLCPWKKIVCVGGTLNTSLPVYGVLHKTTTISVAAGEEKLWAGTTSNWAEAFTVEIASNTQWTVKKVDRKEEEQKAEKQGLTKCGSQLWTDSGLILAP